MPQRPHGDGGPDDEGLHGDEQAPPSSVSGGVGGNGRQPAGSSPHAAVGDGQLVAVDQTSGDSDQTAADSDQTRSDSDQTSAETDQLASDHDQEASDRERTTRQRDQTAEARLDAAKERDEIAYTRDLAARARDHTATGRDRAMAARDAAHEQANGSRRRVTGGEVLMRAADQRMRAAENRARAAEQRKLAAADRQAAELDRVDAAAGRLRARADREALSRELAIAAIDPLTGARTRAAGLAEFDRELDRCRRTSGLLVIAYIDIVGLKAFNDTRGHRVGDALVKRVVELIRKHTRSYDLIIRVGGDEFLCVMSNTSLLEARARFSTISGALDAEPQAHAINTGFAQLTPTDTPAELIAGAHSELTERRHADLDSRTPATTA